MKKIFSLSFIISIFSFFGCAKDYLPLETVPNVDLNKYLGKWYEIASFPNSFQKGCNCTTAEYLLEEDYIRVINTCSKDSSTGEIDQVKGKAFPVENSNNSKLKVQFFWPFRGDYWIIDLADDYSWAVVGTPSRKYLWILCRQPKMDKQLFTKISDNIAKKGFDISKINFTNQECFNK